MPVSKKKHKGKGGSHRKAYEMKNSFNSNAYMARQDIIANEMNMRYQNGGMQIVFDAAFLAAHDVFQMGAGRSSAFGHSMNDWINELCRLRVEDKQSNTKHNTQYSRAKIDEMLRQIIPPEKFEPYEVRYAGTCLEVFNDEED